MSGAPAATQPSFYASYAVADSGENFKTINNNSGSLSGVTPVTLVAAPGGSDLRHDSRDLTIFNGDTQDNTITVRIDVSSSKFSVWEGIIPAGGLVKLENGSGIWSVYGSDGLKLLSTAGGGGSGDVTAAANIPDNAVVTGDGGAKGVQGDVGLTFVDEMLILLVTLVGVNDVGFMVKNTNSVLNPEGWAWTVGAPGTFDGNLMFSSDPTDFLNNVSVRFLPGAATAFVTGAAVADNFSFKSESVGALAFFQPVDNTGRIETKISFVGEIGGTGHEGVFSIEGFAYGDAGLQFHRLAHFVIDPDYRLHIDMLGDVLLKGTGDLVAGETGFAHNATTGLELQGQGTTNDVTIYNDTHTPVIEIPTGTLNTNFAGNIRPAGTVEWDKGADIASAATLVLGSDGNAFDVTGTTDIDAISAKPIGTVILLQFDDVARLNHDATALDLQGNVDMVPETGNTIGLYCYDGTNWREIFRNDGQQVRVSGSIADQAMVRGNGGAKRIQDTGNLIGDDDEIIMAGVIQFQTFTDAQLNDNSNSVNTNGSKVQGAQVYNSSQDVPVWAVGNADGSVWVDGAGTTVNTPV